MYNFSYTEKSFYSIYGFRLYRFIKYNCKQILLYVCAILYKVYILCRHYILRERERERKEGSVFI